MRRILVKSFQLLARGIVGGPVAASAQRLQRCWKSSNTLALLAPGISVSELDGADWSLLRSVDTIGVNYFLVHPFTARAYIVEPHEDRGYFGYLAAHRERFRDCAFFYKGYASPQKLPLIVREMIGFRRAGVERLFMLDERYAHDLGEAGGDRFDRWLRDEDSFMNAGSSLNFLLDLAWRLAYSRVILVGFDFSSSYFYEGKDEAADIRHLPSKVVQGSSRGVATVGGALEYVARIRERGGEVFHLRGVGPLAGKLPALSSTGSGSC